MAQKEYARVGDADLEGLLVDLLVDRSKQNQRDLLQIVLNESLITAPKLTNDQLATLAVIFLLRYTVNHNIGNHKSLGIYFDKCAEPFVEVISKNRACYQHLEFTGCGSISINSISIQRILLLNYQYLFMKGFSTVEMKNRNVSLTKYPSLIIPCLNDSNKLQINASSKDVLKELMNKLDVPQKDKDMFFELFDLNKMSEDEIKTKCIAIRPYMEKVINIWSESMMQNLSLTSVGLAIGHANIKRLIGEFADLSIWIK